MANRLITTNATTEHTMKRSEQISQLLRQARSGFVSVRFVKANGDERQLTTNPRHIGEILGTGKPCKDPDVFRLMDVNLNQWRSFRAERVLSIKVNGEVTSFKPAAE